MLQFDLPQWHSPPCHHGIRCCSATLKCIRWVVVLLCWGSQEELSTCLRWRTWYNPDHMEPLCQSIMNQKVLTLVELLRQIPPEPRQCINSAKRGPFRSWIWGILYKSWCSLKICYHHTLIHEEKKFCAQADPWAHGDGRVGKVSFLAFARHWFILSLVVPKNLLVNAPAFDICLNVSKPVHVHTPWIVFSFIGSLFYTMDFPFLMFSQCDFAQLSISSSLLSTTCWEYNPSR